METKKIEWIADFEKKQRGLVAFFPITKTLEFTGQYKINNMWHDFVSNAIPCTKIDDATVEIILVELDSIKIKLRESIEVYNNISEKFARIKNEGLRIEKNIVY